MGSSPDESRERLDRLADAIEAFLDHDSRAAGANDAAFLEQHDDLRDLLEPMLSAPGGEVADQTQYIGEYRIVRELGRGGMGVVYEAVHVPLDRRVALKVLPGHVTLSGRQIERFRREASAVAKLQHPSIVPIFDVGEASGTHFFAMEFVDGRDLAQVLRDDSRTSLGVVPGASEVAEVAELAARIAEALHYAHEHGVLHRDVKPHNILIAKDGGVRLVDFGLARDEDRHSLSHTGEFAGTPHYASPEQVAGKNHDLDGRTDVFSLGVVLYEMLARARPFDGETTQHVLDEIRGKDARFVRRINARVPLDLAVICHKALEKEPNKRYSTMAEMAADLRHFLRLEPIVAQPPGPLSRVAKIVRRNRLGTSVVLLVTAIAIGVPLLLWLNAETLRERDHAHHVQTAMLLREQVDTLLAADLVHKPHAESEYLERLERVSTLYAEVTDAGVDDPQLILDTSDVLNHLANAYQRQGRETEALTVQTRVIGVLERLTRDHPARVQFALSLGGARHDRALIRRALLQHDEAWQDLTEAIRIFAAVDRDAISVALRDDTLVRLAKSFGTKASIQSATSVLAAAALESHGTSISYWKALSPKAASVPANIRDRAQVHVGLGGIYLRSGKPNEALAELESALNSFTDLLRGKPNDPMLRNALANTRNSLSHAYLLIGDVDASRDQLQRALPVHAALASDFPKTASYAHNLANSHLQMGHLLARKPETRDLTDEHVKLGLPIAERLCADSPEVYSNLRVRASLVALQASQLYAKNNVPTTEKIAMYRRAAELLSDLNKKRPGNAQLHCQLGSALHRLGRLFYADAKYDLARDTLEEAIREERIAHVSNPKSSHHEVSLRNYERMFVNALVRVREYDKATEIIERHYDIEKASAADLVESAKMIARFVPNVAAEQRPWFADRVVARLARAVATGTDPIESLAAMKEFQVLENHAGFRALLRGGK